MNGAFITQPILHEEQEGIVKSTTPQHTDTLSIATPECVASDQHLLLCYGEH
jgi:hypothetical protein